MNSFVHLYNILNIEKKFPNKQYLILYLKYVWGLPHTTIAEIFETTQATISMRLQKANEMYGHLDRLEYCNIPISEEEIKALNELPRAVIRDVELLAFVQDILQLKVHHPFYLMSDYRKSMRMAALYTLGVQQKHLTWLYDVSKSGVNQIVNKYKNRIVDIERVNRYDVNIPFRLDFRRTAEGMVVNKLAY